MKRVGLFITNLAGGGAERVVLNLANMFKQNHIEVHIVLLEDIIEYDISGLNIHILDNIDRKNFLLKSQYRMFLAKLLDKKIKFIESNYGKFDLIISHLPATDKIVKLANIQSNIYFMIHTIYSLEIQEFYKKGEFFRALRRKYFYKELYKNKKLICVSSGICDDIHKFGINATSCCIIYNPFDIKNIKQKAQESVYDIPNEEYIVHVGAYRTEKRHDILLQAYSYLKNPPKLKLFCHYDKKLDNLIKSYNLQDRVEIFGFKKNPYPYIKKAKLLVLSSEREGLPSVLIEALALKVPIVSTNCISGPSEILVDELSSYLAEVNNANDLSDKISKALESYPAIDDKFIDKFDQDKVYKSYIKIL